MQRLTIIDSHTAGEPTRVIVAGGPDLGTGPLAGRRERFRGEFDRYRSAVVNEPRGSDVIVGALLVEPEDRACAAGVIFFNNIGYIGMCGHGTIGVVATLSHLGRLRPGVHRIETPVGTVTTTLHENGEVTVENVASWRERKDVTVNVPGHGPVTGDIAWGGNWFFLVEKHGQQVAAANVEALTDFSLARAAGRQRAGFPGRGSRRAVRAACGRGSELEQLRAVPRQGVRPLALRHRHERQARVPGRRRQARRGRAMGPGEHHREHLQRVVQMARSRARQDRALDPGHRLRQRGVHPLDRRARSVPLGNQVNGRTAVS